MIFFLKPILAVGTLVLNGKLLFYNKLYKIYSLPGELFYLAAG